jgi:hypothetical protein
MRVFTTQGRSCRATKFDHFKRLVAMRAFPTYLLSRNSIRAFHNYICEKLTTRENIFYNKKSCRSRTSFPHFITMPRGYALNCHHSTSRRSRFSHEGRRSVLFTLASSLKWVHYELKRCFCLCGGILQQLTLTAFLSCCTAKPVLM